MQTLQFPGSAATAAAATPRLADILSESAELLEASKDSDDADVREAAIQLAIRALRAAELALTPDEPHTAPRRPVGRVIQGPWSDRRA